MTWPVVSLGEVVELNPRGDRLSADDSVSFVGMAELNANTAEARPLETRPYKTVAKGYTPFRNGDILAAKITPCWENGKIGQAKISGAHGFGSTEFHVLRTGPQLDTRYLLHFLRQDSVRLSGQLRMTGSGGQRRVPASFLADLKVPLPHHGEQRRIAAILDKAEALTRLHNESLTSTHSLESALVEAAFADPSRKIPVAALSDISTVTSGITKGRRAQDPMRKVPYLAVANVQSGHLKIDNIKSIEATQAEIKRYRLEPGDLVLTEGGDPDKLGRGTVWRGEIDECIHQNHIFRVRLNPDSGVEPEYLSAFISSSVARSYFLRGAKQTTGIASINATQLRALPVPLLEPADRARLTASLETLRTQSLVLTRRSAHMTRLFTSLQARAFRGEL